MFEIDLNSSDNIYQFSPKLDQVTRVELKSKLSELGLNSHVFILSSGTTSTGGIKGYALSKEALRKSAKAVNQHLNLNARDSWYLSLPPWHIGGLSVYIRAQIAGAKVYTSSDKWDVRRWVKKLENVSVTSIVPLQAFDIVANKIEAPKGLRYLIIGGDYLAGHLHQKLLKLGWPVVRTFGMTEVCSQLATEREPSNSPRLEVLANHKVKVDEHGVLFVKSESMFTGMFSLNKDFTYKEAVLQEGLFKTNDLVELKNNQLYPKSRADQAFKCKGRLFYLNDIREVLDNFALDNGMYSKLAVKLAPSEREGQVLSILADSKLMNKEEFLNVELRNLLAPAVIKEIEFVSSIQRTELGKVKKH